MALHEQLTLTIEARLNPPQDPQTHSIALLTDSAMLSGTVSQAG